MSKISLPQSPVVFEENPHGYWLEGKRLSGITGLIHAILELGVYPDANDYVQQVAIPRAGAYGTAIHKSIETYDEVGVKDTYHPEIEHQTKDYGVQMFGPFDVSQELETYIKHREGFEPVANEYTISDGRQYASNIDNVWRKISTQGIWLIDTKSNNLDYYPGGVSGLKKYLSWQLSIYAYLFEQQTGLKVEGLACNWLRHADGQFWEIERIESAAIETLLVNTVATFNYGWTYKWTGDDDTLTILKGFTEDESLPAVKPQQDIIAQETLDYITQLLRYDQELKRIMEEFKSKLKAAMIEHGIKSFECDAFKATISADSVVKSFDTTRFKKEHADLYQDYTVEKPRAGSFTIKLKSDQ